MPSFPRVSVACAPRSAKHSASRADVSRTALVIAVPVGFLFALADQLVHDADAGHPVRGEGVLSRLDGLVEGLEADALLVFRQDQIFPRRDAELLAQLGRDDDAACRIDAD